MNQFRGIADGDIRKGEAVTFDPIKGTVKAIELPEKKQMIRVSVNEDRSYTLIQEGITLTEEQAKQIHTAYEGEILRREAMRRTERALEQRRTP